MENHNAKKETPTPYTDFLKYSIAQIAENTFYVLTLHILQPYEI